jgi:hypothetical protein
MELKENSILVQLVNLYKSYTDYTEVNDKLNIFKIFFEHKLLDICEFNATMLSYYLNQLSPDGDKITYEQFLKLLFFIYDQHTKYIKQREELKKKKDIKPKSKRSRDDISNVSQDSINSILGDKGMYHEFTVLKIFEEGTEFDPKYKNLCTPVFEKNYELMKTILKSEIFDLLALFQINIEKAFKENSFEIAHHNIQVVPVSNLINIIYDYNIFTNLKSLTIAEMFVKFLHPQKIKLTDELIAIFDDPKNKNNPKAVKEEFDKIYLEADYLNFPYSTFILFLVSLALKLPENKEKSAIEGIEYFLVNIMGFQKNEYFDKLAKMEEEEYLESLEYIPSSKNIDDAKRMQDEPTHEDLAYMLETLLYLDKEIPEVLEIIKNTKNPHPDHSNKIYINPLKIDKAMFPFIPLKIEVDEKNKRDEDARDARIITAAKGNKKPNPRDPPKKPIYFQEQPNKENEKLKSFGRPHIEDLKNRLLKKSYKDVLANTNIYPSILSEILLIPKKVSLEVFEIILTALKEQEKGNYIEAINQLERAIFEFSRYKVVDSQVDLYFNFTLSTLFQSLGYNLMAIRHAVTCKYIADKFDSQNPNNALAYCCLGSAFHRIREYDWALRCYSKAKEIREYTNGGDSLDCATVYNNMGVCCYMMENFWAANGYFQLAHELYKSHLGYIEINLAFFIPEAYLYKEILIN